MNNNYSGPYWVFIMDESRMPIEVQKCQFRPTINPRPGGNWEELWVRGACDYMPSRLERLTTLIQGHMEAMRPLLEEWDALRKEAKP